MNAPRAACRTPHGHTNAKIESMLARSRAPTLEAASGICHFREGEKSTNTCQHPRRARFKTGRSGPYRFKTDCAAWQDRRAACQTPAIDAALKTWRRGLLCAPCRCSCFSPPIVPRPNARARPAAQHPPSPHSPRRCTQQTADSNDSDHERQQLRRRAETARCYCRCCCCCCCCRRRCYCCRQLPLTAPRVVSQPGARATRRCR